MARAMSLKTSAQMSKMLMEDALDNCLASAKKTYTVVKRDRITIKETRLGKFSEKCLSSSLPPYQNKFQSLLHEIAIYENSNKYQWLEGRNANIRKKFLNFKSNVTFLNQDFGRMFTLMKCQAYDVTLNVTSNFNHVYVVTEHVLRKFQKLLKNCRKVSKFPTCKKNQKKSTPTTTTMAANGMVTKMNRTSKKSNSSRLGDKSSGERLKSANSMLSALGDSEKRTTQHTTMTTSRRGDTMKTAGNMSPVVTKKSDQRNGNKKKNDKSKLKNATKKNKKSTRVSS